LKHTLHVRENDCVKGDLSRFCLRSWLGTMCDICQVVVVSSNM